jgi:hypothetical protein
MSEERFGTALKPRKLKCTSIGRPEPTRPYLCMVFEDGTQIYAAMTFDVARLFAAQAAEVVASWPAEPKGKD